jgi:hypothetical protein
LLLTHTEELLCDVRNIYGHYITDTEIINALRGISNTLRHLSSQINPIYLGPRYSIVHGKTLSTIYRIDTMLESS